MMRLFGGFSERVHAAYAEAHPLAGARLPGVLAWGEGEFDNVRIYAAG